MNGYAAYFSDGTWYGKGMGAVLVALAVSDVALIGTTVKTLWKGGAKLFGKQAVQAEAKVAEEVAEQAGERLVSGSAARGAFSESLTSRAVAAVNEASIASGLGGRNLVDKVIVRSGNSAFFVEKNGRRILYLNEAVVGQANHGMLLREAAHELVHAEQYAKLLKSTGNIAEARKAFLIRPSTYRYAADEVVAETLAQRRIAGYLGKLSDSTLEWSNNYILRWRKIAKARR